MLERQIRVGSDSWASECLDERRTHFRRLQVGDPHPFDALHSSQAGQESLERADVTEILAITRGVLTHEE
jgi:hypothetical protein